jgi:hypothetical protein
MMIRGVNIVATIVSLKEQMACLRGHPMSEFMRR